jgi:DNA polymerase III subunit delta'
MAFSDVAEIRSGVQLLQRSLQRGRLGHAYLFAGNQLEELEQVAQNLIKTLNCLSPVMGDAGVPTDCCDACVNCRKIDNGNHADVRWIRPESKSRFILTDQIRGLISALSLKATEAEYKTAVIVAGDRMKVEAANAFLKTLEEPPPKTVVIVLSTEPGRLLDTIISRCLRLTFGSGANPAFSDEQIHWVEMFSSVAAENRNGLLGRYQLLGQILAALAATKTALTERLEAASPLERYDDADPKLREKWEDELKASIEAEYRRSRGELLASLEWWLRDVWLYTLQMGDDLLSFSEFAGNAQAVASRVNAYDAQENIRVMEQTQRLLHTNVQESLALEVGFLKLKLG